VQLLCGTSGYSYKEWKGDFYPADLKAADMLGYYAERLKTVEINNTFYRMPKSSVVASWAAQVPADFSFVIKATQRITHRARLKDCGETLEYLHGALSQLGDKRGPTLFQLPPNFKADHARLESFLADLPAGTQPAFEFRHASWQDATTERLLQRAGAALCAVDSDERSAELCATASFGYVRLRREQYERSDLAAWAERLRQMDWERAYVFFKHEADSGGVQNARLLAEMV